MVEDPLRGKNRFHFPDIPALEIRISKHALHRLVETWSAQPMIKGRRVVSVKRVAVTSVLGPDAGMAARVLKRDVAASGQHLAVGVVVGSVHR